MKKIKEWFIDAPWGKVALVSWGSVDGEPMLLVHGRQDSAATFIPLLEHLPDSQHYVGVDLPGHGRSDPMPTGLMLTRLHLLAGVEYAVKHLKWDRFTYVGHSMGCEQGLFYNAVHPNQIKEFIFFDPIPSLQRLHIADYPAFYSVYQDYYDNYTTYNNNDKLYSKRQALDAVKRARGLTEEQAELVLSRNMWPVGADQYRLSWDRRLRQPAPTNYPLQYYYELFTLSTPPTLLLTATKYRSTVAPLATRAYVEEFVDRLQRNSKEFYIRTVEGGHDVHLTDPETVAKCVLRFLNRKKAKL